MVYSKSKMTPEQDALLREAVLKMNNCFLEKWDKNKIDDESMYFIEARYLMTKYDNTPYYRYYSIYYHPEQLTCGGTSKKGYIHNLKNNKIKNKVSQGWLYLLYKGDRKPGFLSNNAFPVAESSLAVDFPVEAARKLIAEYGNKGRILDPCAGWGGRMIGALLNDVEEYVGIDPSPDSNRGNNILLDHIGKYQDTKVTLIQKPYEEVTEDLGLFDMAITSPPYFDVEIYEGDKTSTTKFPEYDKWVEGFLKPLIENTMNRLKPEGCFLLNVGDQTYPLTKEVEKICEGKYNIENLGCVSNKQGRTTLHTGKSDNIYKITKL